MAYKNSGFTLIELMIVGAVLGVLTAIAIPQFNEYRRVSNDLTALADVKNSVQVVSAALQ